MGKPDLNEAVLRTEFERQHAGRNLTRHRLRGTYVAAPIAALWNQHRRTAEWALGLAEWAFNQKEETDVQQ